MRPESGVQVDILVASSPLHNPLHDASRRRHRSKELYRIMAPAFVRFLGHGIKTKNDTKLAHFLSAGRPAGYKTASVNGIVSESSVSSYRPFVRLRPCVRKIKMEMWNKRFGPRPAPLSRDATFFRDMPHHAIDAGTADLGLF